eukprot:1306694-Heterocapsa_arctica.AAC.1
MSGFSDAQFSRYTRVRSYPGLFVSSQTNPTRSSSGTSRVRSYPGGLRFQEVVKRGEVLKRLNECLNMFKEGYTRFNQCLKR